MEITEQMWKDMESLYKLANKPIAKPKTCFHMVFHVNEEENRCFCLDCKEWFIYDPYICSPDGELSCYSQDYSTIRNFDKFLRRLRRINPDLPELEPLHNAYIRFIEAYGRCKFYRSGRRIGSTRNLFGNAYTLHRLALLVGETLPAYNAWAEFIKPRLPSQNHLIMLNDHWCRINAALPPSLFSKHGRFQSFAHLLRKTLR